MHSMMTDDIITGKASIKGREDVENVVCSLNRIKAIRGKYSADELAELCDKYGKCQINCGKSR